MRYSKPRRLAIECDTEIEKIAKGLGVSYATASKIWWRRMKGVKEWEKC